MEKVYENYELIESNLSKGYSINDYKNILDRLSDEKSKLNFFYRVMYDNTNDAKYALLLEKNMYMDTNFYSKNDFVMFQFLEFMLTNNNYDKEIYLVGFPFDYKYEDYNRWGIPCAYNHNVGALDVKCIYNNNYGYVFHTAEKDLDVINTDEIYKLNITENMIFIFYNRKYEEIERYIYSKLPNENIFIFQSNIVFSRNGQYFFEDFIKFKNDEVFFDGGAFCLESSIDFMNVVHGNYKKIYAAEPEDESYKKCLELIKSCNFKDIQIENVGIWSHDTVLKFNDCGTGSSSVNEHGTKEIKCKSIDNIVNGNPVTIIKMDIEGSEYEALQGARNTIIRYQPILMICVYHKPNDIFKLTNLILSMREDYNLYIRHHSFSRYETVLYCVPKNR